MHTKQVIKELMIVLNFGKISNRGFVSRLSNEPPKGITEIDGKFYKDGKELKMKKVPFNEFFGILEDVNEKK